MHHLRAVVALAHTENFTRAAQEAGVSQPALSRTIAEAERRIGTPLFLRTTRKVIPTEVGLEVAAYAAHAIRAFDGALARIGDCIAGDAGSVKFACLPSVAASVLPAILSGFRSEYPHVEVVLHDAPQHRVVQMVFDGEVDLGLVAAERDLPISLDTFAFAADPLVALVPQAHPFASRESVSWSELQDQDFIAFNSVTSVSSAVHHALVSAGVEVHEVQRADSIPAVGGLVEAGIGISVVPRLVLPLMNFVGLAVVPLFPHVYRELVLINLADTPLPKPVSHFKELALSHAGPVR